MDSVANYLPEMPIVKQRPVSKERYLNISQSYIDETSERVQRTNSKVSFTMVYDH